MPTESKFALRLPTDLYEFIRDEANKNGKSINEYIVFVLSDYHKLRDKMEEDIKDLQQRMARLEQSQSPQH